MEYTKESLKKEGEGIVDIFPEISQDLIKFASAWAQEVAELRELCKIMDRNGAEELEEVDPLTDADYDRMGELWAKHMKGGEG